jgi:HAD superfamily hydrolase (TIGR01549 family)
MSKYIVFDLDQTLVDTSRAADARKSRNWQQVYSLIPSFILYNGMADVFAHIRNNQLKICIVTTSPGTYAKKVLQYFNIPYDHLVDYFAVSFRKPHPESFLKAQSLLGCECNAMLSFGDRVIDIEASKAAGIKSVACTWGSDEVEALKSSGADFTINHPSEIIGLFRQRT